MLFDEAISSDINVSMVLDEMLLDGTSSDIVVQFLSNYEKNLSEIWRYSDCYEKMFQIDYWMKSSLHSKQWIVDHLKKIPIETMALLCWQACSSSCPLTTLEKNQFNKEFSWLLKKTKVSHPYNRSSEWMIRPFDEICFSKLGDGYEFPEIVAELDFEQYSRMINWVFSSLFHRRFYQLDVFEAIDVRKQWLFLKHLYMLSFSEQVKISSQIYGSGVSTEIKRACFENVRKEIAESIDIRNVLFKNHVDVLKLIRSTNSFDVIQLELAMRGDLYPLKNVLQYYLVTKDIPMLKNWWNFAREDVEKIYDLSFINELN